MSAGASLYASDYAGMPGFDDQPAASTEVEALQRSVASPETTVGGMEPVLNSVDMDKQGPSSDTNKQRLTADQIRQLVFKDTWEKYGGDDDERNCSTVLLDHLKRGKTLVFDDLCDTLAMDNKPDFLVDMVNKYSMEFLSDEDNQFLVESVAGLEKWDLDKILNNFPLILRTHRLTYDRHVSVTLPHLIFLEKDDLMSIMEKCTIMADTAVYQALLDESVTRQEQWKVDKIASLKHGGDPQQTLILGAEGPDGALVESTSGSSIGGFKVDFAALEAILSTTGATKDEPYFRGEKHKKLATVSGNKKLGLIPKGKDEANK